MTLLERRRQQFFRAKAEATVNHNIDTETFRCQDCNAAICFVCGWCSKQCDCGKRLGLKLWANTVAVAVSNNKEDRAAAEAANGIIKLLRAEEQ